jgi:hypothetical protein
MSFFPGSNFTTISGKIKAQVTGPTTERLLIIGTALDGPLNVPQQINDYNQAQKIFGYANYQYDYLDPNDNTASGKDAGTTLPQAISQAIAAGCTDIWAVRATGTYATSASAFTNTLKISSSNPGLIYNQVSLTSAVTGNQLTLLLQQPSSKGGAYITQYASSLTISQVIDKINSDKRNKTIVIDRSAFPTKLTNACTSLGSGTVTLSGGSNGTMANGEAYATTKNGYATLLKTTDTGTYDSLIGQNFRFNVATLTGIYLDDQVTDSGDPTLVTCATDFILFLDNVSQNISPCHGVMATRPPYISNTTDFINYINNSLLSTTNGYYSSGLRWLNAGYFMNYGWTRTDAVAGTVDLGARLSVVAGPNVVFTHPDIGNYTDMWHAAYAALLTTVPPERAPIFKPVPGIQAYGTPIPAKYAQLLVSGVGYDPTRDLSGNAAYVVLTRNPRDTFGPMVIFDDVTCASRDDYMRNYQVVHLCNSIENDLDAALSPFLGGPTNAAAISAMETVTQNILDGYVQSNAFRGAKGVGYDFNITMSGTDQSLGIVRVYVEISPATALRKIYFVVQVRQS